MEKSTLEMSTLVTFARTKGFVYQGSEIYGGLANSWDYGPLGILLKENIKNLWTREFVQKRKDMVMLDAAIMMNPNVWVASGHVGSFSDPLMECKDCNTRHRADKLIEEQIIEIRNNKFRSFFLDFDTILEAKTDSGFTVTEKIFNLARSSLDICSISNAE